MADFLKDLEKLIEEHQENKRILSAARKHILSDPRRFTSGELECMATDGVIKHSDIPKDLRSEHSEFLANRGC